MAKDSHQEDGPFIEDQGFQKDDLIPNIVVGGEGIPNQAARQVRFSSNFYIVIYYVILEACDNL